MDHRPISRVISAFSFLLIAIISAACSLGGLDPAGSDAVLSFTIPQLARAPGAGRAVFSGGMTLYIRTIGASSGPSGVYGPYAVSDSEFSTTDIPAGSYDSLAIIVFSETPSATILSTLTNATDAEFLADDKTGTSLENFKDLCDGTAAASMTGAISLRGGTKTKVSVVLEPLCSETTNMITFDGPTPLTLTWSVPAFTNRFYRIDLSSLSSSASYLGMQITHVNTLAPVLALYGERGGSLGSFSYNSADKQFSHNLIPYQNPLYLYVNSSIAESYSIYLYESVPNITVSGPTTFAGTTANTSSSTELSSNNTTAYDLGCLYSGDTFHSSTFTINNDGTRPLAISSITMSNANSYWTTTLPSTPISIPAGSYYDFTVTLTLASLVSGTWTPSVTINSDDPDTATFVINLTGSMSS